MKKILTYLIFIKLILSQSFYAQRKDGIPNISTPETNKLLKYEDFPNIEAIGGTNITIPIYTLQVDDMEIPISLNYTTKGIKVSETASNTGLGWTLNAGGTITYEVKDFKDITSIQNYFDPYSHDFEPIHSQKWWRTKKGYHSTDIDEGSYPFGGFLDYEIDSSPDFYHINAPGLSDVFFLEKDFTNCPLNNCDINYLYIPRFMKNSNYKSVAPLQYKSITFTFSPNNIPYNTSITSFEKFTFKNEKGYEYNFGQLQGVFNDFWPASSFFEQFPIEKESPNTWYLESVKSPSSSKKVVFSYEKYENSYNHKTLSRNRRLELNFDSPFYTVRNVFSESTAPSFSYPQNPAYNKILYSYFMEPKRLKNIKSDQIEIIFNYDQARQDYPNNALTSIIIKDNIANKIIKTVNLNYSYFLSSTPNCTDQYDCLRLRLDKVKDSTTGEYSFNYGNNNSNNIFPKRSSSKVDFLGYFNDNNSDFQLPDYAQANNANAYPDDRIFYYPNLERDNFLPFQLTNFSTNYDDGVVNRTPNSLSLIGLLSKLQYPTGASLNIEYENDRFQYLGAEYILGTARIKKLKYVDENSILNESNYFYTNIDGTSSGQVSFFTPPSNLNFSSNNVGLEFNTSTIVLYSRVKEEKLGRGSIVREYSNFSECPNIVSKTDFTVLNGNVIQPPTVSAYDKRFIKHFKFPYQNTLNLSIRRGNLTREAYFDGNGNKLKETMNTYDYFLKDSLKVSKVFSKYDNILNPDPYSNLVYSLNSKNNIPIHQIFLKRTSISEFLSNGNLIINKIYNYDKNRNLLINEISTSTDMTISEVSYQYAHNKANQFLVDKNMVGVPMETEVKRNNKIISKTESKYPVNQSDADVKTSGFPQPYLTQSYDIRSNVLSTEINYDRYDSKGNLQQYTSKDGIPISIIWGYNKTQPIAKIEGAKLSDISQSLIDNIVNASNNDAQLGTQASEQDLMIALDLFRNNSALSSCQISTYTYNPLIGVTSITPPSGIREIYIYDTANRLKEVKQLDKDASGNPVYKILKEFKYNYKQ
ncbi:hypothetical protein [Chryseobacterium sp. JM1]|uniref:hypothetical protein n=1 Tax=Chryseobacterium sp. JM1 TaxID=1233950 RepID=UPI0004E65FDD|nr:hypothetical protein [Chryseobacterium sp. JM1]KFF21492.1 hypothetical protein IW22_05880 [Chryseobacterium sp. JM1]